MTASTQSTYAPDYLSPPGDTLGDLLEEREMTQTDLARRLGVSLKHVNQIVKGSAPISADTALRLEKVFSVPADFWMSRESLYQAGLARQKERQTLEKALDWAKKFPLRDLRKRGLLPDEAKGADLVEALLKFLGIASPRQWRDPIVSYRKSQKFRSDEFALYAWLRLGELEAREIETQPFSAERLAATLDRIRALTPLEPKEWHPQLVDLCAKAGVAVAVVETFTGARSNGATRWLSPSKALIQLSLRYAWEDIFWFTFFHEAGHVLLHRKREVFVEPPKRPSDEEAEPGWLRLEHEADRFAMKTLIPPKYERALAQLKPPDVEEFATQLGIAPAIVVGRLQHDGVIHYSQGNNLRRRFEFVAESNE
jgi:HTH-type transcriptional regulator / antitoxin HigA